MLCGVCERLFPLQDVKNSIGMKSRSIHIQFLTFTLTALLLLAVIIGAAGVVAVTRLSDEDSQEIIAQICEKEALRFQNRFDIVEHALETIYEYALELHAFDESDDSGHLGGYSGSIHKMAASIAERTEGTVAVFLRYDVPLLKNGINGFFLYKRLETEKISNENPFSLIRHTDARTNHLGWFHAPKGLDTPQWLPPCYNESLGIYIVTYVIPYIVNGKNLGVLGIDINFNSIADLLRSIKIYETGHAFFADVRRRHLYSYDDSGHLAQRAMDDGQYDLIAKHEEENSPYFSADEESARAKICLRKILKHNYLLISVPTDEIFAHRDNLLSISICISFLIFILTALALMKYTEKIVSPIRRLTAVTKRYAKGQWDESFICNTRDELQSLSESIAVMARTTQAYIEQLNAIAREDGLTGLKNKSCYMEYMEKISRNEGTAYGLLVCDVNGLKTLNDERGHEAGDRLIVSAGRYLCRIFSHSPVFRIGGDEFVVLLNGNDFGERDRLLKAFEQGMAGCVVEGEADVPLSIAFGLAMCPEDGNHPEDVFAVADRRMYEKKKAMKAQSGKKRENADGAPVAC